MEDIFKLVLTTSIYAAIVGQIIVFIKSLLKNKLNAKWHYIIWIVLVLKLIIPFGPQSSYSLFNNIPEINYNSTKGFGSQVEFSNQEYPATNEISPNIEQTNKEIKKSSFTTLRENLFSYIWAAGALFMLFWLCVSYFIIYRKIKRFSTVPDERVLRVYEACKIKIGVRRNIPILIQEVIGTPAIFGVLNPKILLSSAVIKLSDKELQYIIMHELAHYKRKDIFANYTLIILQIIHWFNPVIWYCFNRIRQDMEIATDEYVLSQLQDTEHRDYGKTLITILECFSSPKLAPRLLAMADDKKNIEERLKMIKIAESFRGKRRFVVIVGLLCIVLLSGVLLTDGVKQQANKTSAGVPYNAQELIKYKTSYVGDNVKVVNIINKLLYGDAIKEVYLQTKVQPYGVIIDYDFKDLGYDEEQLQYSFETNATIMFALIDNVDSITFRGKGTEQPKVFTYSRAEVQKKYNIDLREYSMTTNTLIQLMESLTFRVSAFPEKYALTMSSTPGINISAFYYGSEKVEKVRFSVDEGALFNWDIATGKISEGKQTIELAYGKNIYWSPISDGNGNRSKNDSTVIVTFLGERNKELGERHITINNDHFLSYSVEPSLGANQSQEPSNIDEAVSLAIRTRGRNYRTGEFAAEGHVILETEELGETIKVYTMASVGNFGFENGIFTKISGSGTIPTVIILANDEINKYTLLEYQEPEDGGGYTGSIKKMFPASLHEKVFNLNKYGPDLAKQQERQAAEYLKSIGRNEKVSEAYVDKTSLRINVEASNKLFSELGKYDHFINSCPSWIGTIEQIEGGLRYIYETMQSKTSDGYDLVIFRKTDSDGNIVKEIKYKIVGSEPQLVE